jgi:DNA-binding MarR family transcriptional regulator
VCGVTPTAPLDAEQLAAYFALMEVSSLLQHAVEQQLRADGELSYVQFQILARLNDSPGGRKRMTDLADGVVYSRSGLTYQAEQLEKAGLVVRRPSAEDERSITVTITDAGRNLLAQVFPGHLELVRSILLAPLSQQDVAVLTDVLGRVQGRMRAAPPRSAAPRKRVKRG